MKLEEARKYTAGLNGLRGVMALFIMVIHYGYFPLTSGLPFHNVMVKVIFQAQYIVNGFFVLSGFLLVYNYLDKIRNGEITFNSFMKKRLIRLYPMMIFSLLCVIVFQIIYSAGGYWFAEDVISNNNLFTFVLNVFGLQSLSLVAGSSFNAPTWFLSQIIFMYVIFYFVVWKYGNYKKEYVIWSIFIILGLTLEIRAYPPLLAMIFNSRALTGFFAGCILGEVYKHFIQLDNEKFKRHVTIMLSLFFLILIILLCRKGNQIFGDLQTTPNTPYVVYSLCIWPLIIFLICNVPICRMIFSFKPLCFIGRISLCTYVMHFPTMILLEIFNKYFNLELNYSKNSVFLLYMIMVFAISILSHNFIEKKVVKRFNI